MQAVSVYFVFNCIRSLIYSMWEAVSETFHCKFMLSSKSVYIIFCTSIIIVYINIGIICQFSKYKVTVHSSCVQGVQ